VALEQLAESVRITVNVTPEQFLVRQAALVGLGSGRGPLISRLTWPGQGVTVR
jgi:hypothetical protein